MNHVKLLTMARRSKPDAAGSFAELVETVHELRKKCPWDRALKLRDTTRHMLEEAYETVDAIGSGDKGDAAEELGDLIVQSLYVAEILGEQSKYDIESILSAAKAKLVRRHPHVFANGKAVTVAKVIENWERIKEKEATAKGRPKGLKNTGHGLPALMRAEKLGEKARRRGMDWADIHEVLDQVREELAEVEDALKRNDEKAAGIELGDMMLALANAPRFIAHNAEETLRRACEKFIDRFDALADLAKSKKLNLKRMKPEQIEKLWEKVKRNSE